MAQPYELIGCPPHVTAVREDFERFLSEIETCGIGRIELLFGFAWANDIYPGDWEPQWLSAAEIRRVVSEAETRELGAIGSDDLFLTIPELASQRQYCHEADIHLESQAPSAYTESVKRDWIVRGWTVRERTGRDWRVVCNSPGGPNHPQEGA